jgi:hypothetical protein
MAAVIPDLRFAPRARQVVLKVSHGRPEHAHVQI